MARTIQTLVDEVRRVTQDADPASYRVSDDTLSSIINDFFTELWRLRPDAYVPYSKSTPLPSFDPSTFNSVWPVDEQFYTAAVYFTLGRAELADDEHVNSARAADLLGRFSATLVGTI